MTEGNATKPNGRIAWGRHLLLFGVAVWMFILGMLVGRGTAPVEFDTQALQKELAALRDSMVKKERDAIEKAMRGEDEKAVVDFYEDLKKDGPDTTVQARVQSGTKSRQTGGTSHKIPVASLKKKARAAKPEVRASAKKQKPAAAQQGSLTIQVASLRDADAAKRIIANLKKEGYPAYLSKHAATGKKPWFRVRVGYYQNKRQAGKDLARLKKNRNAPILVEVANN
ncbi:sporulation domain protein [Desulfosarcina variabilis str. Montpellier]|uniref:SPOR domain-containing protein n=1 Tax=Desulfosarcina variabilis TaxID=2300 RepID=UPI003AFB3789